MKVSIKQISQATGFSPATVSNALNSKKGVNKDTSAAIFKAAKEMGYVSEDRITKIKLVIFKRTGAIIDDTPFFNLLIDGVEKECRKYGYEMVISNLEYNSPDYEAQVKWLIHDTASAVILLGTELMEGDIEAFKSSKCPLLIFDYFDNSMTFNGVLINNADSAKVATEYLISKGHRKLGYLRGNYRIQAFRSRAVGFTQAMQKHNLQPDNKYIFTLSTTMDGSYKKMLEILKRKPELPTAFFADNDMVALGAMKALDEMGYKIPDDISIIGFDDLPFCDIVSPALTTIHVSKPEMGAVAVKRMHEMITGDSAAITKTSVCTTFVERESVKDITKQR